MLVSIVLSLFYFSFFLFVISRWSFFQIDGFSRKNIAVIFSLKIVFGIVLIEIYSHFYPIRSSTDAFKFYDDAKVIYQALFTQPWDYFRITFGINSGADSLFPYYQKMNHWFLLDNYTIYNDSRSVIRFNALVFPFSFGKYVVHMIFMCFLSLTGMVALFKTFSKTFYNKIYFLAFAVFLLPSVLFWGSGVLKEGLILFASGFLIYFFFELLLLRFSLKNALFFIFFFYLMILIKVHILLSIIPGFILLAWQAKWPKTSVYSKTILTALIGLMLTYAIAQISYKYSPFRMLAQKQKDFINLAAGGFYFERYDNLKDTFYVDETKRSLIAGAADSINWKFHTGLRYYRWSKGDIVDTLLIDHKDTSTFRLILHLDSPGSRIHLNKLEPTMASTLKNIPLAISNTLFRPTIFECKNFLTVFAALENLMISVFLILCIFFFKKPKKEEESIFVFCLSFVVILFTIVGLTTPVLGAMVRYKIPALPFLFLLFLILIDVEKLKIKFPFLKKLAAKKLPF